MTQRLNLTIVESRRIGNDVRLLLQPRHEEPAATTAANAPQRA